MILRKLFAASVILAACTAFGANARAKRNLGLRGR